MSKKWVWLVVIAVAVVGVGTTSVVAKEEQIQGTTKGQLAELELPQPSHVKVVLLPFWDYMSLERHVQDCQKVLEEYFAVEGFPIVDAALVAAAVLQDEQLEPGEPMRKDDAIRLGATLGADWTVYGNILQLETYWKVTRKKAKVSVKLTVVDVTSGEVLFWRQRADTSGGTGIFSGGLLGRKKATSLERRALYVSLKRILEDFFAALPEHEKVTAEGEE